MLSTTSSGNINIKHAPSSKIRVSTVAGFSHDIESTPAFCLAPQKTVDLINTAICTSEEAQWHDINRAPVIVHPLSTVQFPLALAEESQRRTMSRQPSHEPTGSSSLEDMQPQSQQTDFIPSEMTAEVAAGRDEFDFVIQELQEVERHSSFLATNLGAKRIGSSEDWLKSFTNNLNDMSKPEEDHEMQNLLYKIEEVGNRLTKHEDVEEDAESIKSKAKSIADSTSASSRRLRAREIDPALALLTEMGTLRNTRILHEKNKSSAKALSQYKKKMTKQLISPLKRVKSYDTASDAGLFSPDKSKIKSKKQEELLRFSWNSFLQTPFPNNTNHLSDQPIFLTAENGVDEEETGFIQPLSPQFMQLTNQLELDIAEHSAMNKTSLTQQLRQTVKYNRIYSNKNDVEFGYVSSGGCKVSKSWYPCYPKQVYTLNPNEFDNRVLIKHSQSQKIFKSNFQLNQQSDYKIKKAVAPKLLPLYKLPVVPSIHYGVSRSASVVSKTQLENLTYDESNDMKQEMTDTITAENTATIEMNSALQLDFFQNSASNRSVAYTPGSSIAIEVPLSAVKIEPPVQQTYRTVPTPRGLVVRLETDTQSITDSPMKSGPNSPAKPKATSPSKSIIQSRTNSGSNLLEIKGTGTFL